MKTEKKNILKSVVIISIGLVVLLAQHSSAQQWQAQWITAVETADKANTWLAFKKDIAIGEKPSAAIAKIAADSKYWLWINGKMVVFEGGLKRGPNPMDTYYDEVDIAPFLRSGENTIAVLLWYFGKEGFSHKSSGRAGLLFDCQSPELTVLSDRTWQCKPLEAYKTAGAPEPNFRLPESSILYDARAVDASWQENGLLPMPNAVEMGTAGSAPWNQLVLRPIPLFKDFGLQDYDGQQRIASSEYDTIVCQLPYNAQMTPYFKINAPEDGQKIIICTDNYLYYNGGDDYIRAEYITRKGIQEYENLGWLNGHKVYYIVPKGVEILDLKYRESGYDTDFAGSFACSDPFFNKIWEKSRRTLYLTMRDSYMDCPDRERAQWTGDAVNESGETFYALSPSSHALSKKWLLEIIGWQRPDGSLFSPVPAGNWDRELPDQLLATIGYYGLWNYYLHTGDKQTLERCYAAAQKYLSLWEPDGKGTVKFRGGDWTWGDWGSEKDMVLIFSSFYYLALKGMQLAAIALDEDEDAADYLARMDTYKKAFNALYWTGACYRHPVYSGKTDDRVQALAVVSGLADEEKFPALLSVFKTEEHASPYMEKYVMEALFQMGEVEYALERHKKRFGRMVDDPNFSTLWEGWNFNDPTYGGGTVNHAWSGGALTVLSQYLCGISPIEPGYKTFQIVPQVGEMAQASATVSTVSGYIRSSFVRETDRFALTVDIPAETSGIIGIPSTYARIFLNDQLIWQDGKYQDETFAHPDANSSLVKMKVNEGKWKIVAQ
ncbi:alpha-L-rhamnosidase C-terminal domain-containing protein [Olivibacter sitiensis]|uniref:alpha-L-rhamnosidase-related protein n=1 Tax=Olivibacter sitiensis TaxID=376470 RepID=UPI000A01650D|nr:alpha-L-rhamnosidase C-terminal domain-containing protein [Olivibacter sitiensis]